MPFMLAALLRGGGGGGVALSPLPLLRSLLQQIMAPLLLGVTARACLPGALLPGCSRRHLQDILGSGVWNASHVQQLCLLIV